MAPPEVQGTGRSLCPWEGERFSRRRWDAEQTWATDVHTHLTTAWGLGSDFGTMPAFWSDTLGLNPSLAFLGN